MKLFNQLLRAILVLVIGMNTLLYSINTNRDTEIKIITDDKVNSSIENRAEATDIVDLSGHFTNSSVPVSNYIIKSLPSRRLGILYMPNGTTPVKVGQALIQADADCLLFDPVESCTAENATFTYLGVSNTGVEGTVATITIPLTISRECITVVSDDKRNPKMVNQLGATDIIDLSGEDSAGNSVDVFIITFLPPCEEGILFMEDGESEVRIGQVLTLKEANGLKFDPNPDFIGDSLFNYVAVDSNGVRGNSATVTIPVIAPIGGKPVADDKVNPEMANILGAVNILDLSGKDGNGDSIKSFLIASLPNANQGTLYMIDGETPLRVNQILTQEEGNGLKFDPKDSFVGDASFTYIAIDTNGLRSLTARVTIPLIHAVRGDSPVANNLENPEMLNRLDAMNILDLSGVDNNGVPVEQFIITLLPVENQGMLYMEDGKTEVKLNQRLTQEEANALRFDPNESFVGNVIFTYIAVDDNGLKSANATVTIPLVNPVVLDAPVADSKDNPEMLNILGAVNILDLSGKDSNANTIENFMITQLPTKEQGILYMEDGITAVVLNQNLSLLEANGLKFDPNINFIGDVIFTYIALDNDGKKSANATVTIPLFASRNINVIAHNDEGHANDNADDIVINVLANDTGLSDGTTIYLLNSEGNMVEELIVDGEGEWTIDEDDRVVFTPSVPFIGTPTPISYLIQDPNGAVSNSATIGVSGRCICKAYLEDIPVFTNVMMLLLVIFITLLGSYLIRNENLD